MKLEKKDFIPFYGDWYYFKRYFDIPFLKDEDIKQAVRMKNYHLVAGAIVLLGVLGLFINLLLK